MGCGRGIKISDGTVADGKVVVSTVTGTVATLKTALGASVIKQIDVPGRLAQTSPAGEEVFEL
jgi:hypothetical protein